MKKFYVKLLYFIFKKLESAEILEIYNNVYFKDKYITMVVSDEPFTDEELEYVPEDDGLEEFDFNDKPNNGNLIQ